MTKKYKKRIATRKVCWRYFDFSSFRRIRRCRIEKFWRPYSWAHEKGHFKGNLCWIGLQLGPSAKPGHAFSAWNDHSAVDFKAWSPDEPNFFKQRKCRTT